MKYRVDLTNRFKKDVKRCIKRGLPIEDLEEIVSKLENGEALPEKCKQHKLDGDYPKAWECHIHPDWLLVWEQNEEELLLLMLRTGTHSDLF